MHKTQILKDIYFFLRGYDQLKAIEDVDVFTVLSDFLHVWTKTRWDVSPRDVRHIHLCPLLGESCLFFFF